MTIVRRPTDEARHATVEDWLLRLKDDALSDEELAKWLCWSANAENLKEFEAARRTWQAMQAVEADAAALLESGDRESRRFDSTQGMRLSLAAAIVGIMLIAGYGLHLVLSNHAPQASSAASPIRSSLLPDGSKLTVAPRTEMSMDFAGPRRVLALSKGEAFFDVRADKLRPFVVKTPELTVTAVGTAFDVRSDSAQTLVTVQEGVVVLVPTAAAQAEPQWRLAAGQQLVYDKRTRQAHLNRANITKELTWREGRLEYFAAPLNQVVADLNRYGASPIEIGDTRLAELRFTGTVMTDSLEDWLAAVEATFPVRVSTTRDHHKVLLSRAGSAAPNNPP